MAAAAVSQNFYTKTQCAVITAVAYCGLALLLIGIISQNHWDIFARTQISHVNAVTMTAIGSTIICVGIIVVLVKKHQEKVKKSLIDYVVEPAKDKALQAYNVVEECCNDASKTFHSNIGRHLKDAAILTANYVKENYKNLFGYLLAWAAIVVGFGLLHGFKATALPLTIGMSGGFALGIAVGVITVKSVPLKVPAEGEPFNNELHTVSRENMEKDGAQYYIDRNSLWGLLTTRWLNDLDADGTKMIIQTVLVTILMTFTPIFPVPAGGFIGAIAANALVIQMAYERLAKTFKTPDKATQQANRVEKELHRRGTVIRRDGVEHKA